MKPKETKVLPESDVFFYNPSTMAERMFFYPVCLGHYYYEPGYRLVRNSYDSFLLMYILQGECEVVSSKGTFQAGKGQLVFIDCYEAHEYSSGRGWECLWLHFDGPLAREYYETIAASAGNRINPTSPAVIERDMRKILSIFLENKVIREVEISGCVTDILNGLLLTGISRGVETESRRGMERITTYINEHLGEELSLARLASVANLSPYYFARSFKKETGKAPHEYVMACRIHRAKFYLKTTEMTVEEIGHIVGFPTASSFCASFRKQLGSTPLRYRNNQTEGSEL